MPKKTPRRKQVASDPEAAGDAPVIRPTSRPTTTSTNDNVIVVESISSQAEVQDDHADHTDRDDQGLPPPLPPVAPLPSTSHLDIEVVEQQAAKKRKRANPLVLTEEQEEDIVEWLKEHPILYVKGMKEYKNTSKKQRIWEEKARELGLESGSVIVTWYDSMRTRLGKLTLKKSGDGTKELTDREKWVLDRFTFLNAHISRVPSRQACKLKAQIAARQPQVGLQVDPGSGSEVEEDEVLTSTPKPSTSTSTSTRPKKIRATKEKENDVIEKLMEQQATSEKLQDKIENMLTESWPPQSSRAAWGAWMSAMANNIHDDCLESFYRQSFDVIMSHMSTSDGIRAREKQQPEQSFQFAPSQFGLQQYQYQQYQQPQPPQQCPQAQPTPQPPHHVTQQAPQVTQQAPQCTQQTRPGQVSRGASGSDTPVAGPNRLSGTGSLSGISGFSFLQDLSLPGLNNGQSPTNLVTGTDGNNAKTV